MSESNGTILAVSPHCHPESHLTGSTLSTLIKRAKELKREYFAHTDHGHLSSALKAYGLCKKQGLKFIPGIEIYFKDSKCPFVSGTQADRCKYFTATIYCKDQDAYQALCKMVSRTDFATIDVYEEKQQLWTWKDLEEISHHNISFVIGGIHCMVGKPMLAGRADVGQQVLQKLKSIFGLNLWAALVCEPWTKKWSNVVEIKYTDGSKDTLLASDIISTDRARRIKAIDLTERNYHTIVKSRLSGITYYDVNKNIQSVKLHKGFLPLPGGDAMLKVNKFLSALANKYGDIFVMVSDYSYYANKEDKIVQTMRLEGNNKLQPNLHMKTFEEIGEYLTGTLKLDNLLASVYIQNNRAWAKDFDGFKLDYKWRLAKTSDDPLQTAMGIIERNGRMQWDNQIWVDRLKEELDVISRNPKKDLTAYFLPIHDVLNFYKENGLLTGPGRGSAGGSLFCYLLGITQVDPFEYDLPFQRFFSLDRIMLNELPDIDVDLEDREALVGSDSKSGFLYSKYGDKAAQISTRTTIRLKSAIKDTTRYFHGKVPQDVEIFTKGLPSPPQGINDHDFVFGFEDNEGTHIPGLIEQSEDLRKYSENKPEEWAIVSKAMGLTRAFSTHASAFVLSDQAISDTVPTKEGYITQYEAKECEAAGLIKYDFLVVSQLKDLRVCLDLINKKNKEKNTVGYFTHNGEKTYIWKLPKLSQVFHSVWSGQTETLFQINTRSMQPFVVDILPESIMDLATILALVRPGPMDFIDPETGRNMVEEYVLRRRKESEPDVKELADLLPETFGIITFQEQLNKIARNLAGFPGDRAEFLRKFMAKKKMKDLMEMKPDFIAGAIKKVYQEVAEGIWDRIVTFGRYGFSIIHAVEYALITYACMFLRHFYPMEWWAAVLTNATEGEITGTFWPYVKDLVLPPDINLSGDTMAVDYANSKIRSKLGVIRGVGDATIEPIINGRPYADINEFVNKEVAGSSLSHKLIHVGVLDSLFPPKLSLLEKLKMYEDAIECKKYTEKVKKAQETGKKIRKLQPNEGVVPQEYVNIHPIREASMKKAVLPSLPIDLFSLGKKYSKALDSSSTIPTVFNNNGYRSILINGEKLKRLDEVDGHSISKDVYVASTCFIIKASEFPFAKGTKRALKLIIDADGYVSEKVLWPEYESGKLVYPKELTKGSIATIFFRKRVGKKDMSIQGVVVEASK